MTIVFIAFQSFDLSALICPHEQLEMMQGGCDLRLCIISQLACQKSDILQLKLTSPTKIPVSVMLDPKRRRIDGVLPLFHRAKLGLLTSLIGSCGRLFCPPNSFNVGLCPLSDSVIIFVLHREKHAPPLHMVFLLPADRTRQTPCFEIPKLVRFYALMLITRVSLKCPDLKHFIVSLLDSHQRRHSCFPRDVWECRVGRQALRNPALESQSQIVKHRFNHCS